MDKEDKTNNINNNMKYLIKNSQKTLNVPVKILDWIIEVENILFGHVIMHENMNIGSYDSIKWSSLSENPNSVRLLECDMEKINWSFLSSNTSEYAIDILEKNIDKIHWNWLTINPSAIRILENNPDKIDWRYLSLNINAIHIIE